MIYKKMATSLWFKNSINILEENGFVIKPVIESISESAIDDFTKISAEKLLKNDVSFRFVIHDYLGHSTTTHSTCSIIRRYKRVDYSTVETTIFLNKNTILSKIISKIDLIGNYSSEIQKNVGIISTISTYPEKDNDGDFVNEKLFFYSRNSNNIIDCFITLCNNGFQKHKNIGSGDILMSRELGYRLLIKDSLEINLK